MTALLKLSGLGCSHRTNAGLVPALSAIDLTLEKNEFITIVGSPGSGKTTLVNVIAGFEGYDSGHYLLLDRDASKLKTATWAEIRARHIGVILRKPVFLEGVDLIQNVALPLVYTKLPSHVRMMRALSALRLLDLEAQAYDRVTELSNDQLRRAAIARALIIDPDFILADEPTADLEPASRALVLDLLSTQRNRGRAVLIVTENPALADWADTSYILEKGSIFSEPVGRGGIEEPVGEVLAHEEIPEKLAKAARPIVLDSTEVPRPRPAAFNPMEGFDLQPAAPNPMEGFDLQPSISELERETGSIFGDCVNWRPAPYKCPIPIDISIEEILTQIFVRKEWWRPEVR